MQAHRGPGWSTEEPPASLPPSRPPAGPPSFLTPPLPSSSLTHTRPRPREAPLREGTAGAPRSSSLWPAAGRTAPALARGARRTSTRETGARRARAPPGTRTPSLAHAPGRASAARRRAHPRQSFTISLPLAPLLAGHSNSFPTSPAKDFFPPSP